MDYKFRFYSPLLGRFISPDTISPDMTQGLNRYSYVANRPVNFNDPTGHFLVQALVIATVAVVGWLVFAPPVYAPTSQEDLEQRSKVAEERTTTKIARWIDKNPVLYVSTIATVYYARRFPEIKIGNNIRIAPFGNATKITAANFLRTITGNLPHIHLRLSNYFNRPGIKWHRPWDDIVNFIKDRWK